MALDHPFDHPDNPTGSFSIRLDRRGIQREQARSVWSRLVRRRAPGYGSGGWAPSAVCAELGGDGGDCTAHAADRMGSVLASHGGDPLPREVTGESARLPDADAAAARAACRRCRTGSTYGAGVTGRAVPPDA